MKYMRNAWCSIIVLVLIATMWSAAVAYGEFLKTGAGVFQSIRKRAKVIVSQEEPGIFILFGDEVDLQVFDPTELKKDQAAHLFLRFDPTINRFVGVSIGAKEYRIVGNLSLVLEAHGTPGLRIALDNSNPYLTLVVEGGGNEVEIIGFLGLEVVVNYNGQEAVALLEANQLSDSRGGVEPYRLKDGEMYVKGRPVSSLALGVSSDIQNPCLQKGAMVLQKREIDAILDSQVSRIESKQRLGDAIQRSRSSPPLRGLLKIRVTSASMIALDPTKAVMYLVRETRLSGPGRKICSIEKISLPGVNEGPLP